MPEHEESMPSPMAEMPKYRCHKEVWALKIKVVHSKNREPNDEDDGQRVLYFENERYAPRVVSDEYRRKHNPQVGGYYVVYKDGYKSFSPAQAFEEGYSLIPDHVEGGP